MADPPATGEFEMRSDENMRAKKRAFELEVSGQRGQVREDTHKRARLSGVSLRCLSSWCSAEGEEEGERDDWIFGPDPKRDCVYQCIPQVTLHGMDEGLTAKLCRGILHFAIACSNLDATKVCRNIDRIVLRVAASNTLNSNVELGERSGFKQFRHGVTEYLRNARRIDGGWYISILRHLHVALCTTPDFFQPYERAKVGAACALCIRVHCALRLPLKKHSVEMYQETINELLKLAVDICAPSTPSECQSIKFHWPRHWSQTRIELGCSAHEKTLERKLGESHKKNYAYTNKQAALKDRQMEKADHRRNQLRDLLHHVRAAPMTDGDKGYIMQPATQPHPPTLVNKAKMKPFNPRGLWKQLPKWMVKKAKIAAMAKVQTSPYLNHASPHTMSGQISMTLRNRQLHRSSPRHLVKVTFRAVEKLYGKPRFDNVKVMLDAEDGNKRMYFARCVSFFNNNNGDHFVLLRWYTAVGRYPLEPIPQLAHLRLSPPFDPKSYDVLPVDCIMNGALVVPHGMEFWALMSPREQDEFEEFNNL